MELFSRCINTLFVMLVIITMTKGDYECVCSYDVEQPVYSQPSLSSATSGIMYEFDCKPVINEVNLSDARFQALQFEKQVVYLPVSNSISKQLCQGSVPSADKVLTPPMPTSSSASTLTRTIPLTTSSSTSTPTTNSPLTTPSISSSTTFAITSNRSSTTPMDQQAANTSNTTDLASNSPIVTFNSPYTTVPSTVQTNALSALSTTVKIIPSTTSRAPTTTHSLTPFVQSTTAVKTSMSPSTTPMSTAFASSTVLSTVSPHCPTGWVLFQTSCYKFHTSGRTTWDIANADCKSKRSHIVFVESIDEDRFLQTYLSNHIDIHINDNSDTGTWIGATEMGNSGSWVWRDSFKNTDTRIGYNHWHPGQPDSSNERCAGMIGRHNFEWHDYECSQSMFYACETSAAGTGSSSFTHSTSLAPNQHSLSLANCESGWTQHRDSCYLFVTDRGHLEWEWARNYCVSRHSRLAIIETQDEDLFLANEMRKRINTDDDDEEDTGVWLAGSDDSNEGRWMWRDTLRHTETPISGYTNWYPGEPDSGDNEKDEDCLCMIGNKGFQWQDWRCRDNMYAICEKPRTVLAGLSLVG